MNTSQQAPAAPSPAAPSNDVTSNGSGVVSSYDERAAATFGESVNESTDTPAAPAAAPDAAAAQRAERRRQLDAALAQERQRVDAHSQRRANDDALRRAQAAEQERDALKEQVASRIDVSSLDEQGFFDLAAKLQVTPDKLGKWLQQRAQHPEVIAAQYAQKSIDPKLTDLQQQIQQQNHLLEQFAQERQQERATQHAYARGESMVTFASSNAGQAPYTARFLEAHGAEEFLKLANSVYAGDRPGWEQHTLDAIEDNLSQLAHVFSPSGASPAKPSTTPHQNPGAAKPMTTVSNTLAQSRASVVDEEADFAKLPYEERARRLFG